MAAALPLPRRSGPERLALSGRRLHGACPQARQGRHHHRPRLEPQDGGGAQGGAGHEPQINKKERSRMSKVEIFTDGACKGNPGAGGWGALLVAEGHEKAIFGGEANTTNNRMAKRAWKPSTKEPGKNEGLCWALDAAQANHQVEWR